MRVYEASDSPEWSCAFFCLFTARGHPPIFGVVFMFTRPSSCQVQ